jgi:hypothetical protein
VKYEPREGIDNTVSPNIQIIPLSIHQPINNKVKYNRKLRNSIKDTVSFKLLINQALKEIAESISTADFRKTLYDIQ